MNLSDTPETMATELVERAADLIRRSEVYGRHSWLDDFNLFNRRRIEHAGSATPPQPDPPEQGAGAPKQQ